MAGSCSTAPLNRSNSAVTIAPVSAIEVAKPSGYERDTPSFSLTTMKGRVNNYGDDQRNYTEQN